MGDHRTAFNEVLAYLMPGEKVQFVQFGRFGRYEEAGPIPVSVQGHLLSYRQAAKYLNKNTFYSTGDYGAHAFLIYTNKHILYVNQHMGHTWIDKIPRYPREGFIPELPEN
jgi:hypothetical protein